MTGQIGTDRKQSGREIGVRTGKGPRIRTRDAHSAMALYVGALPTRLLVLTFFFVTVFISNNELCMLCPTKPLSHDYILHLVYNLFLNSHTCVSVRVWLLLSEIQVSLCSVVDCSTVISVAPDFFNTSSSTCTIWIWPLSCTHIIYSICIQSLPLDQHNSNNIIIRLTCVSSSVIVGGTLRVGAVRGGALRGVTQRGGTDVSCTSIEYSSASWEDTNIILSIVWIVFACLCVHTVYMYTCSSSSSCFCRSSAFLNTTSVFSALSGRHRPSLQFWISATVLFIRSILSSVACKHTQNTQQSGS